MGIIEHLEILKQGLEVRLDRTFKQRQLPHVAQSLQFLFRRWTRPTAVGYATQVSLRPHGAYEVPGAVVDDAAVPEMVTIPPESIL